jgi:hemoglobin
MAENPHFEQIGGEPGVRTLVDRFYDLMDELPEAYEIRKLHPDDLSSSREKLFLFLTGWMGGPPLYVEKYGHPRLRMRHMPFTIGERERNQWMMCMDKAMAELELEQSLRLALREAFYKVADFMRNQGE